MKVFWSLFVCSILAASLWAQEGSAPAPQPVPPQAQPGPGSQNAPLPIQAGAPDQSNAWRAQRAEKLNAQLDQMRAKLAEMKVNAAKVKDPTVSKQLQLEEELLAMMITHVDELSGAVLRMATGQAGPQNRFANGGTHAYPRRSMPQQNGPGTPTNQPPAQPPAQAPTPAPNQ